ncbi:hypothetical protein I7I53_09274 [Histoplasma capsulatum var. duboisii H88]|uniref:Uncharacterized protein n=1 Tax=Ajellomyces capsulatus (strain H88) TaxID=544711 RepID=A0A8A1LB66_AJEC8|nr:hypothetical protein I7I53_09274 [Histoplasma capsulatum var. duboisii H88]
MAAAGGGVNFVRYFFYAGNKISSSRKKTLVALAYATARDQILAPKAILIQLVLFSFLQVSENPTCTILPPSKANMSKIPKAGMAPSPSKPTIRLSGNSMWHRMGTRMTKRTSS